jgi:hypothetical protein
MDGLITFPSGKRLLIGSLSTLKRLTRGLDRRLRRPGPAFRVCALSERHAELIAALGYEAQRAGQSFT